MTVTKFWKKLQMIFFSQINKFMNNNAFFLYNSKTNRQDICTNYINKYFWNVLLIKLHFPQTNR